MILHAVTRGSSEIWLEKKKFKVQSTRMKLTVKGINSKKTIDTQIIELKLTLMQSGNSCPIFAVEFYVGKGINFGNDEIIFE